MSKISEGLKEIFIGRQPIFDRNMHVYAYELLFRDCSQNRSDIVDGDQATTTLILNTFTEFGFDNLVGSKLAFINLTKKLIMEIPPFPKDRVVVEILEDVVFDKPLIESLSKLYDDGYTIALDDFEINENNKPAIQHAHIIKLDILALSEKELIEHVEHLKPYNIKLLAEKIETHEQFEQCKQLGFSYFQGYFLSKPKVVSGTQKSTNKMVVMQLLSKLSDENMEFPDVEKLLSEDPKLSYKLLKIINSAAFTKVMEIESLHQAVVYLGVKKLKEWASILALSNMDNKPHELMITTMVRAKMCEMLAEKKGINDKDACFTVGLFSTLSAMMDQDIETLLKELPIRDDVKAALIKHEGQMGELLDKVIAYVLQFICRKIVSFELKSVVNLGVVRSFH